MQFSFWAPAPNRHLEEFLAATRSRGWLAEVHYGSQRLRWRQLGTAPVCNQPDTRTWERVPGLADLAPHISAADFHLVCGFAHPLCPQVMRACGRGRRPFFVWGEALQPRPSFDPQRLLRDAIYRRLVARASGAFAVGALAGADFGRLGIPVRRLHPALYPGPAGPIPHTLRAPNRVVYCGRLIRQKGVDLLARAMASLAQRVEGLTLELVGAGEERSRVHDIVAGTGVHLVDHGEVSSARVTEILSQAAVLVLPARVREGWGFVVNEALAAGVLVVVSDVVGARELVVSGRTGLVFPSENVAALEDAIAQALALASCRDEVRRSTAIVHAALSPDVFAQYFMNVAQCVLAGDRAPRAPWHDAVETLGGNAAVQWWRANVACDALRMPDATEHTGD